MMKKVKTLLRYKNTLEVRLYDTVGEARYSLKDKAFEYFEDILCDYTHATSFEEIQSYLKEHHISLHIMSLR